MCLFASSVHMEATKEAVASAVAVLPLMRF
jgi:hypothetical protein